MKTIKLLAALAVCGLAAGCGVAGGTPAGSGATATTPPTPRERLLDSVPDDDTAGFTFTVVGEGTDGSGAVDPAGKRIKLTTRYTDAKLGFGMDMAFLVVDRDSWVKITFSHTEGLTGLPKLPRKWLHLDPAKVKDNKDNPLLGYSTADPAGAAALFGAITSVRAEGDRYRGTLDLTQAAEADIVDADKLRSLGEKAKSVPFEATVDGQGRLTSLRLDIPGDKYQVTYRGYGTTPKIEAPAAGQAQEAPASAYDLLNG